MSKTQKTIVTGLLSAAGAVSAFFGVRALQRWLARRSEIQQERFSDQARRMSDMPVEGITGEEITINEVGAGTPGSGSQSSSMPTRGEMTSTFTEGRTTGGTEVGENYQGAFEHEQEEAAIPTTGLMGPQVMDRPETEERDFPQVRNMPEESAFPKDRTSPQERNFSSQNRTQPQDWSQGSRQENIVETDQPVPVGSLVGPLIVHLLSFHNMMDLLQRRRDTVERTDTGIQTPDVRAGGADAVSSLEGQVPEFERTALVSGSLQERIVQMMDRIRDALQNTDYKEDDLFQISNEMRPAVCKVLDLIKGAGEDNVTGFEDVQKAYQ